MKLERNGLELQTYRHYGKPTFMLDVGAMIFLFLLFSFSLWSVFSPIVIIDYHFFVPWYFPFIPLLLFTVFAYLFISDWDELAERKKRGEPMYEK